MRADMDTFLRSVVGLNWASSPYRAVVWVPEGDQMGAAALNAGFLTVILTEDGGLLCRITTVALDRIDARLPFVVRP